MIAYHQGKNSGSFTRLSIAVQSGADFPFPTWAVADLQYTDTITADWLLIDPLPGSGSFTETSDIDDGGNPIYGFQIQCIVNKDRQEITSMLAEKLPYKLIVLLEDSNGQLRLVGNADQACWMSYVQTKENGLVKANSYTLTITCSSLPHPALYYSGASPVS